MAKLAIKGHSTRGSEVIALLEMVGGKNDDCSGKNIYAVYAIPNNGYIYPYLYAHNKYPDDFIIFTLEEFLEKYPYKVGDEVIAYAEGCLAKFTIQDMRWNYELNKVEYKICSSWIDVSLIMQRYKEEIMESKPNLLQQLKEYFDKTPRDVIEKEWNELSYLNEIGPSVDEYLKSVKKYRQSKYPKTYEECCRIVNANPYIKLTYDLSNGQKYYYDVGNLQAYENIRRLKICRDAYWKIAGEQMGLGRPWEPTDDKFSHLKYVIQTIKGEITCLNTWCATKNILEFPTEEVRDAFYENFKDLIEECKMFL